MKRRFSRTDNAGLLSGGRALAGVLIVIVLIVSFLRFVFPDALIALTNPLFGLGNSLTAAVGSASGSLENAESARIERDQLKTENDSLKNENARLSALLADLTKLSASDTDIVAGVTARPPLSPYDTLLVSKGSKDGVRSEAQVYGPGSVPIGTVLEVSSDNARVSLYSTAGRETLGWAGEQRIPVSLYGTGSGSFRATLNKDTLPVIGDQVYVPGPGALPIGTVEKIATDPSLPTATVFIRPLTNPFVLTWVAIAP